MTGFRLFDRVLEIRADGVLLPAVRTTFRIEKSLKAEPNRAVFELFNLAPSTRKSLQAAQIVTCKAGYAAVADRIFVGDVTQVESRREGPEWMTKIESGDGVVATRGGRTKGRTYPAGTTYVQVAKDLMTDMGVDFGNVITTLTTTKGRGELLGFVKSVVSGNSASASEEFDKLMKTAGLEWSMQDGTPQVTVPGKALPAAAPVLLSSSTGLLGSPETGDKGIVRAQVLLTPRTVPGVLVQIDSKATPAVYRVEKVCFSGDTHGQQWFADLECTPVKLELTA